MSSPPVSASIPNENSESGAMTWQPIETAPKDGTRFIGRRSYADRYTGALRYEKRRTWFGKTSHIPLYGWCHGRDVENIDLWQTTHWKPLAEQQP
jgi:hypothetical protein